MSLKDVLRVGGEFRRDLVNTATADRKSSVMLPVKACRQWERYSCTSAVLQMVAHFLIGAKLTHREAMELLEEDGVGELEDVLRVLKGSKIGFISRELSSHRSIPKAIDTGHIILGEDCTRYDGIAHAIVICGYNRDGYWTVDPMLGIKTWRSKVSFRQNCNHLIAIKEKAAPSC